MDAININDEKWNNKINLQDVVEIYHETRKLINPEIWQKQSKIALQEIKTNPFLKNLLTKENNICFGLCLIQDAIDSQSTERLQAATSNPSGYAAINFFGCTLLLIQKLNKEEIRKIVNRIIGSIRNPDSFPGLFLELRVALNFCQDGFKLQWPVAGSSIGADFILPSEGDLHIECKAITSNKGRRIHEKEEITFMSFLERKITSLHENLEPKIGNSVVIKIPKRLPSDQKARIDLVKNICNALINQNSISFQDGVQIIYKKFDHENFINNIERSEVIRQISTEMGHSEDSKLLFCIKEKSAIICSIQSTSKNDNLERIYKTLADAGERQLPMNKPGFLIAQIENLSSAQIISFIENDKFQKDEQSFLSAIASRLLSKKQLQHVIGITFFSDGDFFSSNSYSTESGRVYKFWNDQSIYWRSSFKNFFSK